MRRFIKAPVMALLKMLDLYSLFMLRQAGPLREDGWFRSFREKTPVDADGNALPWITYPAIAFLAGRLHGGMSVFEYGCGASTLWWAQRVKDVTSVEHEREWYEKVVSRAPANVIMTHVPLDYGGAYAAKIAEHAQRFDIVVLDGRDRVACARNSLGSLKEDGVIIWDNSDREEYAEGFRFLHDQGFRKIEFVGYAPACIDRTETAIFYRSENCLGI